jgi:hypothetical protein
MAGATQASKRSRTVGHHDGQVQRCYMFISMNNRTRRRMAGYCSSTHGSLLDTRQRLLAQDGHSEPLNLAQKTIV